VFCSRARRTIVRTTPATDALKRGVERAGAAAAEEEEVVRGARKESDILKE
jgi:hypothetical protein